MINVDAENTVIGCLLKDGELIKETVIQPHHFFDKGLQEIYKTMQLLDQKGEKIDIVSLVVESKGKLDKKRLADLFKSIASLQVFKHAEKNVLESYTIRQVNELQKTEISSIADLEKLKDSLSKIETVIDDDKYDHKQAMIDLYNDIESQEPGLSGLDTGFRDLNKLLDGFQKGNLIISAARPSTGKTAKMLTHAIKHCQNGGVAIISSLETPERDLNKRMLSSISRINGAKMRNPKQYFNENDWDLLSKSIAILSEMDIYILDKSGQTPSYIRQKVVEIKKNHPGKDILLMIDYLQLMRTDRRYESKNIEVGEISRSLKELARDENIPVYLLSQLSRGVTSRQDKRPQMQDIRDSGSVEQDKTPRTWGYKNEFKVQGFCSSSETYALAR